MIMQDKIDYIGIYGPTASGKTALSLRLADQFPIEVISVDSALIYKDMDIGTAKPTKEEQSVCPHHLIDIITPDQSFSVGQFQIKATELIHDIRSRGKLPVLVGGTALYFQSLLQGYSNLPTITDQISDHVNKEISEKGTAFIHQWLCQFDQRHQHIKPNDTQRITRAACVIRQTNQSIYDFWEDQKPSLQGHILSINPAPRDQLRNRIHQRLQVMLKEGFIEETQSVIDKYQLSPEHNSMRCVGYRQIYEMLSGNMPKNELADRIFFATCQYAKRQITWLNKIKTDDISDISYEKLINSFIKKIL
jgi:tRNA dimethylallyltransferase